MIIIHFNGVKYYYTTEGGVQLSKGYKTIRSLQHHTDGKLFTNKNPYIANYIAFISQDYTPKHS